MQVRIRQVVLDAFRGSFLAKAEDIKKEYDAKGRRSKLNVPTTVFGKGFCKDEDLVEVAANDERLEHKAELKVGVSIYMLDIQYI